MKRIYSILLCAMAIMLFSCQKNNGLTLIDPQVDLTGSTFTDGNLTLHFIDDSNFDFYLNADPQKKSSAIYQKQLDQYIIARDPNASEEIKQQVSSVPVLHAFVGYIRFSGKKNQPTLEGTYRLQNGGNIEYKENINFWQVN